MGGLQCRAEWNTLQCTVLGCSTVQYSIIQYSTVQYSTVQDSTVQYSTVQYNPLQCSTVPLCSPLWTHITQDCRQVPSSRGFFEADPNNSEEAYLPY